MPAAHPITRIGAGPMKIINQLAILAAVATLGWCSPSLAQQAKSKAAPNATQANASNSQARCPPPPGWVATLLQPDRSAPLECAVEETAVLTKTGQLIVLVQYSRAQRHRAPVALVQLPSD